MPFNTAKKIIKGDFINTDEIKGKEFVLMKILSFSSNLDGACRINKYMFTSEPEYTRALLICELNKLHRLPKWIKSSKRKNDNLDKFIVKYQDKFPLRKSLIQENYELFRFIVENNIEQFLRELGETDKRVYKKFGIEIKENKAKQGLEKWF